MAKFLVRLQVFLAGEDFLPTPDQDYFDDDNGTTAEAEFNILAAEGVFAGTSGRTVDPASPISRQQMASVLTRKLEVFFEAGLIDRLFEEDDTNQQLTVEPGDTATQDFDTTRDYTVTGVDTDSVYRVTLVDTDFVMDPDGTATFVPRTGDGSAGQGGVPCQDVVHANPGPTNAVVSFVNNIDVDDSRSVGNISPVNNGITFRVTSEDLASVIPAVYVDNGPLGGCTLLELGEDNTPIEIFGLGGRVDFLPPEAEEGQFPFSTLLSFDTERDFLVLDSDYNTSDYDNCSEFGCETYFFDEFDEFTYDNNFGGNFPITQAQFESYLSPGDAIGSNFFDSSGYAPMENPELESEFVLNDRTADQVTGVTAQTGDFDADVDQRADDARFTWDAATGGRIVGYFVNVYEDDGNDTNACEDGTFVDSSQSNDFDGDPVQLTADVEELDDGDYCATVVAITQSFGSSAPSAGVDFTIATTDAPFITSAVLTNDAVLEGGVTAGDTWTLTFNEEMEVIDNDEILNLVDADGDTFRVQCGADETILDDGLTAATCTGPTGAGSNVVTIEILETGEDRNVGGGGVGDGVIDYEVTITSGTGFTDVEDMVNFSVANSTDLEIGPNPGQ